MKRPDKRQTILINLILFLVVTGGYFAVRHFSPRHELKTAPSFELPLVEPGNDTNPMASLGTRISLKELQGRLTLINFWASWCEACAQEAPILENLWKKYGNGQRIYLLGISTFDKWSDLSASPKLATKSFPILFDDKGRIALKYGVTVLPATILLNSQGRILATFQGILNEERLRVIEAQIP
ncbi:MAG: TlpA family protein disulfide reductase [Bdellovibrionaceae bacterium]|nr:TlpA family protein disulfide reductase [Bdellovibrionales bacterium]MCB9082691.1 TlpA family protein disulfide reductase [Pseudobdellovibrionaceae bacterium]